MSARALSSASAGRKHMATGVGGTGAGSGAPGAAGGRIGWNCTVAKWETKEGRQSLNRQCDVQVGRRTVMLAVNLEAGTVCKLK